MRDLFVGQLLFELLHTRLKRANLRLKRFDFRWARLIFQVLDQPGERAGDIFIKRHLLACHHVDVVEHQIM